MKITLQHGLFVAEATYDERSALKSAGFRFCRGTCDARWKCGRCTGNPSAPAWWTDVDAVAARLIDHCDSEAAARLQVTVRTQALSSAADTAYQPPAPAGQAYRPFQRAGIRFVLDALKTHKGALIADDMGIGKTIQALGLVNADPSIRRVLVLCPKSLQLNWLREADRWLLPKEEPWRCYVAEITAPVPAEANLVICNYDKLVGRPGQVVAPSLVRAGKWDLVVYDEAHYCKNPRAARTEVALRGLPPAARKLLFLTGTPIENRPVEIQPILEACDPERFPFWPFVRRFCDAHTEWVPARGHGRGGKEVWKFDGHSNLEELNAILRSSVMVRRRKTDVLQELPPKVRQIVELPQEDAAELIEREEAAFAPHAEAVEAAMALDLAGSGEPGYAGAVASLSSKVNAAFHELAAIRHELGRAKVEPALEWIIGALDGGVEKMVVWAWHLDVIDALVEGLNAKLGGSSRAKVRKVDGDGALVGQEDSRGDVDLRMSLRVGAARGGRPDLAVGALEGVHGLPTGEARAVQDAGLPSMGDREVQGQEVGAALLDSLERRRDPEEVPGPRDTDSPREAEQPEQRVDRSTRSSVGLRAWKRLGRELPGEHGEAQPHSKRAGKAREGDPVTSVDGRDSSAERQEAVDRFQNDPTCRVFVGQVAAAGVGITLTAASTEAFVEADWIPGRLTQAEDRCHRIGQTDSVNVYHLVFDGSLDARMLQVVLEKQAVQDAALDSQVKIQVEAAGAATTGPTNGAAVTEPEKKWPEATPEERSAAKQALRFLAERCDGALREDGAGFSKIDARIGKELAARSKPLTDGQVFVAKRLARKYRRQLPSDLTSVLLGGAA